MASLLNTLEQQIDARTVQQLGQKIGADEAKTEGAIAALLPLLIGGLSREATRSDTEMQALDKALEEDHDGSLLDQLPALLGGAGQQGGGFLGMLAPLLGGGNVKAQTTNGDGILGHILGGQRSAVEQGVGRATGLGPESVGRLASMLAPVVMGALGKVKQQEKLDANGVKALLEGERRELEAKTPGAEPGGLLKLLDSNKDGKVDLADDIAKVGLALGTALLFGKKRQA